jgi:hypothetical protein
MVTACGKPVIVRDSSWSEEGGVRRPAVAGRFYPEQPEALAALVDQLLADVSPGDASLARAYVVPHAALRYSGVVAATVYARLKAVAEQVRRVVLIGPAHHVPLIGCAVPAAETWLTPLGAVPIDTEGCRSLARDGHAVIADRPHTPEHALEVQLPFLQRVLPPEVPILPIAVGRSTLDDLVVSVLAAAELDPTGTVVLCSTDLSHYQDDDTARRQDARTAQAVLDLCPERIGVRDACGVFALRGLTGWARHERLSAYQLALGTSADTGGDRERVVGYAAFSFH